MGLNRLQFIIMKPLYLILDKISTKCVKKDKKRAKSLKNEKMHNYARSDTITGSDKRGARNMKRQKEKTVESVGVKSFITAIVVIFAMMVLTYALTFIIPQKHFYFYPEDTIDFLTLLWYIKQS